MREIKFRAWEKENKKMWFNVQDAYDWIDNGGGENEEDIPATHFGELIDNDDWILMQYTGLTDKNDKEIYENDFVSGDYTGRVIWCDGKESWKGQGIGWIIVTRGDAESWIELTSGNELEVVGNIYENPALKVLKNEE